ncbi:MAG: 16S rRNA (cytosine(1402)-N(4))-methyltransferase RsmH [bacterium]|nr:16S rRNA (cytosine(1402)-N(4))-methyltransferase RsmH [bacterium]
MAHIPVLPKEVIEYLDPKSNENFIDCTLGGGGHALAILEKTGPNGKILGIDADPEAIKNAESKIANTEYKKRLIIACGNFKNLKEIVTGENFKKISGILLDLGMSSSQLEESGRGFSFQKKEPLDMRYDPLGPVTAEKIVNYWSYQEIERILKEYGEEQFSQIIARQILEARKIKPIETTLRLVEIIEKSVPGWYRHKGIHFATKTFQALRIAVNGELDSLKSILPQALETLEGGGRVAIISFHSLEDRIVKNFLRDRAKEGLISILTKKPIVPQEAEIKINPRSRSAKLRSAIKL